MANLKLSIPSPDSPRFARFSKEFDRAQKDLISIGNKVKKDGSALGKYVDRIVEIIALFVTPPSLETMPTGADAFDVPLEVVMEVRKRVKEEEAAIKEYVLDLPLTALNAAIEEIGQLCAASAQAINDARAEQSAEDTGE